MNSDEWIEIRNFVRDRDEMTCKWCGRFITGRSIVDHIIPMTEENFFDYDITWNPKNLQLLCLECHNTKTFEKAPEFDLSQRKDVNLF